MSIDKVFNILRNNTNKDLKPSEYMHNIFNIIMIKNGFEYYNGMTTGLRYNNLSYFYNGKENIFLNSLVMVENEDEKFINSFPESKYLIYKYIKKGWKKLIDKVFNVLVCNTKKDFDFKFKDRIFQSILKNSYFRCRDFSNIIISNRYDLFYFYSNLLENRKFLDTIVNSYCLDEEFIKYFPKYKILLKFELERIIYEYNRKCI